MSDQLLKRDRSVVLWRTRYRNQCLTLRARLALRGGAPADALPFAQQALAVARQESDPIDRNFAVASSQIVLSEALRAAGQQDAARGALEAALAAWPKGVEERPREVARHAVLLGRLGHDRAAYDRRLAAMGYRHPAYVRAL